MLLVVAKLPSTHNYHVSPISQQARCRSSRRGHVELSVDYAYSSTLVRSADMAYLTLQL
jgi:hypothetical protein